MPTSVYRKNPGSTTYRGWVAEFWVTGQRKATRQSDVFNTGDEAADEAAAREWATLKEADRITGALVDRAGREVTVAERYAIWLASREAATEEAAKALEAEGLSTNSGRIPYSRRRAQRRTENRRAVVQGTVDRDKSYFKNHIIPVFGDVVLQDLTFDRIVEWINELLDDGYAVETVRKAHGLLSSLLKDCVKASLIRENPCALSADKLPPVVPAEMMYLDFEEIEELVAHVDPRYRLAVRLAAYSGLRISELFGLQVRHLNFATEEIEVRQQLTRRGGVRSNLKTRAGRREVLIPRPLMEALALHVADLGPSDFVFTAPEGGKVNVNLWRNRFWYPAAVAAGFGQRTPCTAGDTDGRRKIPCEVCGSTNVAKRARTGHYEGLRFHDLRHTAITLWMDQGRKLDDVARMAGHVSTRLIDERYGHNARSRRADRTDEAHHRLSARLAEQLGSADNVVGLRSRRSS